MEIFSSSTVIGTADGFGFFSVTGSFREQKKYLDSKHFMKLVFFDLEKAEIDIYCFYYNWFYIIYFIYFIYFLHLNIRNVI